MKKNAITSKNSDHQKYRMLREEYVSGNKKCRIITAKKQVSDYMKYSVIYVVEIFCEIFCERG